MILNGIVVVGWLLVTTIACYGTYDKIKSGRAAFGRAGNLYVERDRSPTAYWVSVIIGCLISLIFIGAGAVGLYNYFAG